jgi:hypothetical protein
MELALGAYSLPLIVSLLLRWIYSLVGAEKISNRAKQVIPVVLGIGMAYLYMLYTAAPWTVVNVVDNTLYGIINLGFAAIGFYETTKKG